jgi:ribosomal protein S18 acetylase RimI-like enzyme
MKTESPMNLDLSDAFLRTIQEDDAPFMRSLYALTRDDLRSLPMPETFIADLIAMQQQVHETGQRGAFPAARRWIVERRGEAVGRVVVDMGGTEWRLVDIAILPVARRQGIGAAILRALQRDAAAHGAAVALAVARSNGAARRLYIATGFTVRGGDELQEQMIWRAPH